MAKQDLRDAYVPLPGDERFAPPPEVNKRGQARPQDKQRRIEITPAMLEEARAKRVQASADYMANPPRVKVGHTVVPEVLSCSDKGDQICCTMRLPGLMVRPEAYWVSDGSAFEVCTPARKFTTVWIPCPRCESQGNEPPGEYLMRRIPPPAPKDGEEPQGPTYVVESQVGCDCPVGPKMANWLHDAALDLERKPRWKESGDATIGPGPDGE